MDVYTTVRVQQDGTVSGNHFQAVAAGKFIEGGVAWRLLLYAISEK